MPPHRSARHAGQHANTDRSSNLINSGTNEVTVPDNAALRAPREEILSTQSADRAFTVSATPRTATDAVTRRNKRKADRALSETDQDGDSIPGEEAQVSSLILFRLPSSSSLSPSSQTRFLPATHIQKKQQKLRDQYFFLAC